MFDICKNQKHVEAIDYAISHILTKLGKNKSVLYLQTGVILVFTNDYQLVKSHFFIRNFIDQFLYERLKISRLFNPELSKICIFTLYS